MDATTIGDPGLCAPPAVSKQPWPGDAVVNVSLVNWVKGPSAPPEAFVLDGAEVAGIATSLRAVGQGPDGAGRLAANAGRAFQGPIPAGAGFVLTGEEAQALLDRDDAPYRDVVRPYLVGDDIANDPGQRPTRFVIDSAMRALEEAMEYPAALEIVRGRVKPGRDRNNRKAYRDYWWRFAEPRPAMRAAVASLSRYIAANAQGKRILSCWCDPWTCPSNLTNVFAFEDDYAMGVLSSRIHGEWARLQSSTLREDIRYTPTSAFETFPWPPSPSGVQRDAVARAAAAMITRRGEICEAQGFGLTALYNRVDEGAYADLRDLHRALDEAVAAAYGWPVSVAHDRDDSNTRLLALNHEIVEGRVAYAPFAGDPG